MFQNFDDPPDSNASGPHIAALRDALDSLDLDGFILPRTDEHLGEEMPASAERLAWLTGFTGSAGTAIILKDKAAIFVDGRYTLQVRQQVDTDIIEPIALADTTPTKWLAGTASEGMRIGFDPWQISHRQAERLTETLRDKGVEFIALPTNPIDALWVDRPDAPKAEASLQDVSLAGQSAEEKIREIQAGLEERGADATILTDATSTAWALNLRGKDVPHTPVVQAFTLIPQSERPVLFINQAALSPGDRKALSTVCEIAEKDEVRATLESFVSRHKGCKVEIETATTPHAIALAIEKSGGTIADRQDAVALPRARKSGAEIEGAKAAHLRDGAAMLRFLSWLNSPRETSLTEIEVAEALEGFRAEAGKLDGEPLVDISFDTIAGTGPNGALPHYRVTHNSNRQLTDGDLMVVDSGGQYRDGTTDITRTILIGSPGEDIDEKRDRFTRVLKGHIAVATARFPKGTSGAQLDALARQYLWMSGLDFDHGTGHGVGSFLSVHEGPQRISKTGSTPLEPGMILSNEPGFYLEDRFGIRIENLIFVKEPGTPPGGDRALLAFEDLTLAPIDRRLIARRLLSPRETSWLDLYHQRVFASLSGWPGLSDVDRSFLAWACRPIAG